MRSSNHLTIIDGLISLPVCPRLNEFFDSEKIIWRNQTATSESPRIRWVSGSCSILLVISKITGLIQGVLKISHNRLCKFFCFRVHSLYSGNYLTYLEAFECDDDFSNHLVKFDPTGVYGQHVTCKINSIFHKAGEIRSDTPN